VELVAPAVGDNWLAEKSQAMSTAEGWLPLITVWTGREVRALRLARRMSVRIFAAHLGVTSRMVSLWEAAGVEIRPRPVNQAALATSLRLADQEAQRRFSREMATVVGTGDDLVEAPEVAAARCLLRHPVDRKLMTLVPSGLAVLGHDDASEWVPGFFVDVYPVTNADYCRFVRETGHRVPMTWTGSRVPGGLAMHPVVGVSSVDVQTYAAWAGKQIPTDRQWEKAARGTDGRRYPWGNEPDHQCANTRESHLNRTTPVHWFPRGTSSYGVYDMQGNVCEWTIQHDGPSNWEARGGAFTDRQGDGVANVRCKLGRDARRDNPDFRCVLPTLDAFELWWI
jgi:DNA-binding transcriptional regulator YiaG